MRVQFRFAIVVAVWSLVIGLPLSGWAAQGHETLSGVRLIGSDQDIARPSGIQYERGPQTTKRADTSMPARAPALKDLFFKPDPESAKKASDSIAVEPWFPGRGSVGVKVEVTW
jgi:hypothetical protein